MQELNFYNKIEGILQGQQFDFSGLVDHEIKLTISPGPGVSLSGRYLYIHALDANGKPATTEDLKNSLVEKIHFLASHKSAAPIYSILRQTKSESAESLLGGQYDLPVDFYPGGKYILDSKQVLKLYDHVEYAIGRSSIFRSSLDFSNTKQQIILNTRPNASLRITDTEISIPTTRKSPNPNSQLRIIGQYELASYFIRAAKIINQHNIYSLQKNDLLSSISNLMYKRRHQGGLPIEIANP